MPADSRILPAAPAQLLAVCAHEGAGYKPLVDYESWRVAILNYAPELEVSAIARMQRHNETDEVFVLLAGRCLLFTGEGGDRVERVFAEDLKPGLVYNVRRGVWHHHTLSRDAKVLVVENRDTTYDNSPFTDLSAEPRAELARLRRLAWGE